MVIHQVLRGPRDAPQLDLKHTAVVTTPCTREASPHLPPLPFRNGKFFAVAALLSMVESSGHGHIGLLSHDDLFYFLGFFDSIGTYKNIYLVDSSCGCGCETFFISGLGDRYKYNGLLYVIYCPNQ